VRSRGQSIRLALADPTQVNLNPTGIARETKCKFAFDRTLSYVFFLVVHFAKGDEVKKEYATAGYGGTK
jgi:hypothetical protein